MSWPSLAENAFVTHRALFVTEGAAGERHALLRALAVARLLRGELEVLQLGERSLVRRTHRWCNEEIPGGLAFERVHWSAALPLARAIEALPRELAPSLVVMAAGGPERGRMATRVALDARVPVLVAGCPGESDAIVVATDLAEPGMAVVREAGGLARRLAAPLLALHNVATAGEHVGGGPAADATSRQAVALLDRLESVVSTLGLDAETVVTRGSTAAEAVARAAKARRADVVVVGAYRPALLERLASRRSVAAEVIDACTTSVLVVPMVAGATSLFSHRIR